MFKLSHSKVKLGVRKERKTVWSTVNKIASEVKRLGLMDLPTFCMNLNMSPSTFWNYSKLVTNAYPNIVFEHSLYKWRELPKP